MKKLFVSAVVLVGLLALGGCSSEPAETSGADIPEIPPSQRAVDTKTGSGIVPTAPSRGR